jgi:pentatricopeptide repeat protein
LENFQQDAILICGLSDHHDIGLCEMQAKMEGTKAISTNATRCAAKLCYFCGMLKACASTIALHEGKFVHEQIIESGWNSNVLAGSSLIDMYVKCASMEDAWKVLHKMPSPIGVLWTTILGGSAMHGHDKEVLKHFEQMCEEGV